MKKIILFLSACFPLLFSCCEGHVLVNREFTSEYIFKNATASSIRATGREFDKDEECEIFVLLPDEEIALQFITPGSYCYPLWVNKKEIYMVIVDNGEKYVISELYHKPEPTGLFREEMYEFISESNGKRTCRFVFTDDYFKDGEPMENLPTE